MSTYATLRTIMETGSVRLSSKYGSKIFPANFQLILTANLCDCYARSSQECICDSRSKIRHKWKIPGYILEKIAISIEMHPLGNISMIGRFASPTMDNYPQPYLCSEDRVHSLPKIISAHSGYDNSIETREKLISGYRTDGDLGDDDVQNAHDISDAFCDTFFLTEPSSKIMQKLVRDAKERSILRWGYPVSNAKVPAQTLLKYTEKHTEVMKILHKADSIYKFSYCSYENILRVSCSIADFHQHDSIQPRDLLEAIAMRCQWN